MKLGVDVIGAGQNKVVVLHDWFADCTSYHPALPYLNTTSNSFAFVDLRGYGKSKHIAGTYQLDEVTEDIVDTIQALGWSQYHLMGYSMSALMATNAFLKLTPKPRSMILVCPVGPQGMPEASYDEMTFMAEAAELDDEKARLCAHLMTGNRYGNEWATYKVHRWRETSVPAARVAYMHLFVRSNITKGMTPVDVPTLVMAGQRDNAPHLLSHLKDVLPPYYKHLAFEEMVSGHYPMQETPVAFAHALNQHLLKYRYG